MIINTVNTKFVPVYYSTMENFSKTYLSLLLFLSVIMASSCTRHNNDVIPDVFVDFTLDLENPEFAALTVPGSFDTISAATHGWGYLAAGYNDNGIIVYSGPDDFHAYDRTCPYDFAVNSKSVKIKVTYAIAICPECGTTYDLSAFGTPASGPGRYPLKVYNTSFTYNRYLRVWNP
jgi:nitrite reductase/ring-hydroxylating ferredoxin subunit